MSRGRSREREESGESGIYHSCSALCIGIGVGGGGKGGNSPLPPCKFQIGGANFTHCLHNEIHCSVVDGIVPQGNTFLLVKKNMSPPPKSEHLPTPMLCQGDMHTGALLYVIQEFVDIQFGPC